jgi:hypothetical protein
LVRRVAGVSGEAVTTSVTGSTACAQQPHVTHMGGQVPSSGATGLAAVHGSGTRRLDTPDALTASTATTTASTNRNTAVHFMTRRDLPRRALARQGSLSVEASVLPLATGAASLLRTGPASPLTLERLLRASLAAANRTWGHRRRRGRWITLQAGDRSSAGWANALDADHRRPGHVRVNPDSPLSGVRPMPSTSHASGVPSPSVSGTTRWKWTSPVTGSLK